MSKCHSDYLRANISVDVSITYEIELNKLNQISKVVWGKVPVQKD